MRAAMRGIRLGMLVAAVSPLLQGAEAQEVLTLDRALEIAERRNPTYRQAFNNVELNASESRSMWFQDIFPRTSLTLFNTGFNGNLQRNAFDNFGNPIERPEAEWAYFSNTRQSLTLNWSIQGSSLFQVYQAQKLTNRGREAALGRALTELEVSVRRLYMDHQEQREPRDQQEIKVLRVLGSMTAAYSRASVNLRQALPLCPSLRRSIPVPNF